MRVSKKEEVAACLRRPMSFGVTALIVLVASSAPGIAQVATQTGAQVMVPPTLADGPLPLPKPGTHPDLHQNLVEPMHIVPITGIGLSDDVVRSWEQEEVPRGVFTGPLFVPDGTNEGPVVEDLDAGIQAPALLQDFIGIGRTAWRPPDPDGATGRNHMILVTNDHFAVYDKCGNNVFENDINDFLGITGKLFDPRVIYDPWNSRWVMLYLFVDSNTTTSQHVLIISSDERPFGLGPSWYYRFNAETEAGSNNAAWADYYDLSYGPLGVYTSGNQFKWTGGFRTALIRTWDKAQIYIAAGAGRIDDMFLTNADGTTTDTPRAADMQVAFDGNDAIFINSRWGGGNKLTLWKLADPHGAHNLTRVDLNTFDYDTPPNAVQPSGATLDTIDCRLMNAVVTSNAPLFNQFRLYTGGQERHNWGENDDRSVVDLWEIDPSANTIVFATRFGASGSYYWFASCGADYGPNNFWTFAKTGPAAGAFAEMRFVDIQSGIFSSSSRQIKAGANSYTGFRWGDYFGAQMDWGDWWGGSPGWRIWMFGEWATSRSSDWGTWIGMSTAYNPGVLGVGPRTDFIVRAYTGCVPSTRKIYTLSNSGEVGLNYTVTGVPSWIDVTNPDGEIFGGGNTDVVLQLNSNADNLGAGVHNATITFTDCYNGGNIINRNVQLTLTDCDADFNGDCRVDTLDFLAYLNAFSSGNRTADCNGDGSVNTLDFLCFLNLFAAGCP